MQSCGWGWASHATSFILFLPANEPMSGPVIVGATGCHDAQGVMLALASLRLLLLFGEPFGTL